MAGNHNSGRKSWDKEIQSKELWNLSIPVLKHALTSEAIPFLKKSEIALALFNKMAPTKIEGEGFNSYQTFVYMDQKAKEEVKTGTGNNRIAPELSSK